MLTLPKVVLIGQARVKYKVVMVKDKKWAGKCSSKKRKIYLCKELNRSNEELLSTFIHELLHAIEFESHIPVKHRVIYQFEAGLLQFMLNNNACMLFTGDTFDVNIK